MHITKAKVFVLLLSILLLNLFTVIVLAGSSDASKVETINLDQNFVGFSCSRKTFYGNNTHYVFYSNGTELFVERSPDAISWYNKTDIGASVRGNCFSIWYNTTHVAYARCNSAAGQSVYYRLGTVNSDLNNPIITWVAAEQIAVTGAGGVSYYYINMCIDNTGYSWVSYSNETAGNTYPYVTVCNLTDGTWSTCFGFPKQLNTTSIGTWIPSIVPLSTNKTVAIYSYTSGPIHARYWNGLTWAAEAKNKNTTSSGWIYCPTVLNDIVYVAFNNVTTNNIVYTKFTYSTNSFSSDSNVFTSPAGGSANDGVSLTVDTDRDLIHMFVNSVNNDTVFHLQYSGASWTSGDDWFRCYDAGLNKQFDISSSFSNYNGNVSFVCQSEMSVGGLPFNITYGCLWGAFNFIESWNGTITGKTFFLVENWSSEGGGLFLDIDMAKVFGYGGLICMFLIFPIFSLAGKYKKLKLAIVPPVLFFLGLMFWFIFLGIEFYSIIGAGG